MGAKPVKVVAAIPFRGDFETLSWTLGGFAEQSLASEVELEVRVGGDGCALPALPKNRDHVTFVGRELPRVGSSHAKNLLLEDVTADVVMLANSDTRPRAGCVQAHVDRLLSLPKQSLVLGSAPYEQTGPVTVWDRLRADTPLIFFYGQMTSGQWYDYRHSWTMNLSVRREDLRAAGGFSKVLFPYGYDDLEMAFRMLGERRGIYFDAAAEVVHRHPMTVEQYLDREEMLGLMAPTLAPVNATMFERLFGTLDLERLRREYEVWCGMDLAGHGWIYRRLKEWAERPAADLGPRSAQAAEALYQMHVPLKRLAFRLGFLRGLELADESRRAERVVRGLWRTRLGV